MDTFFRERRNFFSTTKGDNKCRADEIRIDGMRVEASDKTVSYNEDNVPEFTSRTKATLRLFGCGFNDQTMITFTQDANNRNDACLIAAAGQFKVRSEGLLEYTAVVDIVVPNAENSYYYFCVRNADDNEKVQFVFRMHVLACEGNHFHLFAIFISRNWTKRCHLFIKAPNHGCESVAAKQSFHFGWLSSSSADVYAFRHYFPA